MDPHLEIYIYIYIKNCPIPSYVELMDFANLNYLQLGFLGVNFSFSNSMVFANDHMELT